MHSVSAVRTSRSHERLAGRSLACSGDAGSLFIDVELIDFPALFDMFDNDNDFALAGFGVGDLISSGVT